MLSSSAHEIAPKGGIEFDNLSGEKGYSAWRAYGQSKMANLLFAKELARRFTGTARTANALHGHLRVFPVTYKVNCHRAIAIFSDTSQSETGQHRDETRTCYEPRWRSSSSPGSA